MQSLSTVTTLSLRFERLSLLILLFLLYPRQLLREFALRDEREKLVSVLARASVEGERDAGVNGWLAECGRKGRKKVEKGDERKPRSPSLESTDRTGRGRTVSLQVRERCNRQGRTPTATRSQE
jgi:hypothetical protein